MSFLYRVLGIPRTIDEFVDKAGRRGVRAASVMPVVRENWGEISYTIDVYTEKGRFEFSGTEKNVRKAKITAMAKALEFAGYLEDRNIRTKINGTPYPIAKRVRLAVPVI